MANYILPFVETATRHLIKADAEKEIISLSLVSGMGFILFGPGGHAKSALLESIQASITGAIINVKSCHSGLQVDEMKGGINLLALEEEKVIKYNYNYSPLNSDILFLEEMFDMPATTGAGFKDWLTAKAFRDGNEYFKLPLYLVAGVTNREPAEVASAGDWIEALVQRFPLQYRSAWESYSAEDYLELFNAPAQEIISISWAEIQDLHQKAQNLTISKGVTGILSQMLANASSKGEVISPRSAVMALKVARAAAVIAGASELRKEHLAVIKYLPGLADLGASIDAEINAAHERAEAEGHMASAEARYREFETSYDACKKPIEMLQLVKKLRQFSDEVAALKVTDTQTQRRKTLRDAAGSLTAKALEKAEALTNV